MDLTILAFALVVLALPLAGLADISGRHPKAFNVVSGSKVVWTIVLIVVPVFGALSYFAWIRPKVRAADRFDG